ncbi:extensin-like domain-containing protein [Loktanella sp. Alg231-35]|uniref:extensin-like domain-containing protein n=1 Tax=Loktanella sp. Alg231-35 TaxID=1922220 RepID=UPI001F28C2C9|nr:extensin family protein [Loktanella sp. Alg231-35]
MIVRAACLIVMLSTGNLWAQDDTARPVARPDVPTDATTQAVEPAAAVIAEPAEDTVRPRARGSAEAILPSSEIRPIPRPFDRPDLAHGAQTQALFRAERDLFAFSPNAIATSPRPAVRPASIEAAAEERRLARLRGQICGDPSIQGKTLGRVDGSGACGIDDAVRVRAVAGVTLSPQATIDCRTASALKTWVERGVLPAVGGEGGGVSSLRVVSHYSCRTRNNQAGARLSEHSFGRAIDIAGIRLRDGTEMTLLTDWNSEDDGAQLRQMWRAACGPFGTVLGPESNRFHRDHFHFDTARYRSGSYCR